MTICAVVLGGFPASNRKCASIDAMVKDAKVLLVS